MLGGRREHDDAFGQGLQLPFDELGRLGLPGFGEAIE